MKYVLALDGGGVRGAASARFLELLEARVGRPLSDVFDLFAGTSTGAIIAAAMGVKRMAATTISSLYNPSNINQIMNKSVWDRTMGLIQSKPKYDGRGKRKVLGQYFGDTKLGQAHRPTLVVAYDVENRVSAVLKSHHPDHKDLLALDCVDASSAAPLYFPTVQVGSQWLIDGGVVANNPTLCAYAEAKRLYGHDICILSVGTGRRTRPIDGRESQGFGAMGWIKHDFLGIVMDETVVEYQAKTILEDECYLRVNGELTRETDVLDEIDETSSSNLANLKALGEAWYAEFGDAAAKMLT